MRWRDELAVGETMTAPGMCIFLFPEEVDGSGLVGFKSVVVVGLVSECDVFIEDAFLAVAFF